MEHTTVAVGRAPHNALTLFFGITTEATFYGWQPSLHGYYTVDPSNRSFRWVNYKDLRNLDPSKACVRYREQCRA